MLQRLKQLTVETFATRNLVEELVAPDSTLPYPDSIRLLRLHTEEKSPILSASLFLARLQDGPEFEAISYVWGDPESLVSISLNGEPAIITQNLAYALQQVRCIKSHLILWADQICINQENLDERGHQVQLMGRVFGGASRVFICLGSDPEGIAPVSFRDIKKLVSKTKPTFMDYGRQPVVSTDDDSYNSIDWENLTKMSCLEWFNRAWCVQEVSLAKNALIIWGNAKLPWLELMAFQTWLQHPGRLVRKNFSVRLSYERLWRKFTERDLEGNHISASRSLLEVLDIARMRLSATDPRDYIYAFLGHREAQALSIQPSYKLSADFACLDFASQWLLITNDPHILSYVEHEANATLQSDYPSWCPRWHVKSDSISTFAPDGDRSWFKASLSEPFKFSLHDCRLHVQGLIVDSIEKTFPDRTGCPRPLSPDRISQNLPPMVVDLLQFISRPGEYANYLQILASVLRLGSQEQRGQEHVERDLGRLAFALFYVLVKDQYRVPGHIQYELRFLSEPNDHRRYFTKVAMACNRSSLFVTSSKRIALGPPAMKEGDQVCIIYGCQTPFILRPTQSKSGSYILVGPCYVHGLMRGEAVEEREERGFVPQEFIIE